MRHAISNRGVIVLLGILTILAALPVSAIGEVPQQINYQGSLTGDLGNPLNGDYVMVFSIYDVSTGSTAVWWEEQTVTVVDGIYNIHIGQNPTGNPFPETLFNGPRWLGVNVEGDGEMTPRQLLTSTPFAMRAAVADGASEGVITEIMLADDAVTTDKIADGTVTASDIHGGTGSGLDADRLDGLEASDFAPANTVTALQNQVATLQNQMDQLVALLANVTRPDPDTLQFSDVNVRIVNGTGTTSGTGNGLGNLIVGYNENTVGATRNGSHNLVIGLDHEYTSYAGLLTGRRNTISGVSSMVAGYSNQVTANYSTVSGGYNNTASSSYASVSGGHSNEADGSYTSVSGGYGNTASGYSSSVSGGQTNETSGFYSSISGGRHNIASGDYSFVGGGGDSESGSGNEAFSHYSAILGGRNNIAGDNSSPNNHSAGEQATISGGQFNTASGLLSSVSGGYSNTTSGNYSSISGGEFNKAEGLSASVSGGVLNTARGYSSSVSGGEVNEAGGTSSSVSGGSYRSATDHYDWRAGSLLEDH